jgi:hypothetical protein
LRLAPAPPSPNTATTTTTTTAATATTNTTTTTTTTTTTAATTTTTAATATSIHHHHHHHRHPPQVMPKAGIPIMFLICSLCQALLTAPLAKVSGQAVRNRNALLLAGFAVMVGACCSRRCSRGGAAWAGAAGAAAQLVLHWPLVPPPQQQPLPYLPCRRVGRRPAAPAGLTPLPPAPSTTTSPNPNASPHHQPRPADPHAPRAPQVACDAVFALPAFASAQGMFFGAGLLGLHMAMTHSITVSMIASYMPTGGLVFGWALVRWAAPGATGLGAGLGPCQRNARRR